MIIWHKSSVFVDILLALIYRDERRYLSIRKAVSVFCEDEMPDEVDAKGFAGVAQAEGDLAVFGRGFGGAGGVVVGDDDGAGVMREGGREDVSRVDDGSVHGAHGDEFAVDELIAGV